MRIEIKKNNLATAIIVTFHTKTERFKSDYERIKFFRELYGWKQIVPKNNKRYLYRRTGLLDEIPHAKIADSSFMVAANNIQQIIDFFNEWEDKVEYDIMKIMMEKRELMRRIENNL
ncbi:MAG: hypothetical protein QXD48_03150 [Candidatus Aenigmatarchaeota archaeon]